MDLEKCILYSGNIENHPKSDYVSLQFSEPVVVLSIKIISKGNFCHQKLRHLSETSETNIDLISIYSYSINETLKTSYSLILTKTNIETTHDVLLTIENKMPSELILFEGEFSCITVNIYGMLYSSIGAMDQDQLFNEFSILNQSLLNNEETEINDDLVSTNESQAMKNVFQTIPAYYFYLDLEQDFSEYFYIDNLTLPEDLEPHDDSLFEGWFTSVSQFNLHQFHCQPLKEINSNFSNQFVSLYKIVFDVFVLKNKSFFNQLDCSKMEVLYPEIKNLYEDYVNLVQKRLKLDQSIGKLLPELKYIMLYSYLKSDEFTKELLNFISKGIILEESIKIISQFLVMGYQCFQYLDYKEVLKNGNMVIELAKNIVQMLSVERFRPITVSLYKMLILLLKFPFVLNKLKQDCQELLKVVFVPIIKTRYDFFLTKHIKKYAYDLFIINNLLDNLRELVDETLKNSKDLDLVLLDKLFKNIEYYFSKCLKPTQKPCKLLQKDRVFALNEQDLVRFLEENRFLECLVVILTHKSFKLSLICTTLLKTFILSFEGKQYLSRNSELTDHLIHIFSSFKNGQDLRFMIVYNLHSINLLDQLLDNIRNSNFENKAQIQAVFFHFINLLENYSSSLISLFVKAEHFSILLDILFMITENGHTDVKTLDLEDRTIFYSTLYLIQYLSRNVDSTAFLTDNTLKIQYLLTIGIKDDMFQSVCYYFLPLVCDEKPNYLQTLREFIVDEHWVKTIMMSWKLIYNDMLYKNTIKFKLWLINNDFPYFARSYINQVYVFFKHNGYIRNEWICHFLYKSFKYFIPILETHLIKYGIVGCNNHFDAKLLKNLFMFHLIVKEAEGIKPNSENYAERLMQLILNYRMLHSKDSKETLTKRKPITFDECLIKCIFKCINQHINFYYSGMEFFYQILNNNSLWLCESLCIIYQEEIMKAIFCIKEMKKGLNLACKIIKRLIYVGFCYAKRLINDLFESLAEDKTSSYKIILEALIAESLLAKLIVLENSLNVTKDDEFRYNLVLKCLNVKYGHKGLFTTEKILYIKNVVKDLYNRMEVDHLIMISNSIFRTILIKIINKNTSPIKSMDKINHSKLNDFLCEIIAPRKDRNTDLYVSLDKLPFIGENIKKSLKGKKTQKYEKMTSFENNFIKIRNESLKIVLEDNLEFQERQKEIFNLGIYISMVPNLQGRILDHQEELKQSTNYERNMEEPYVNRNFSYYDITETKQNISNLNRIRATSLQIETWIKKKCLTSRLPSIHVDDYKQLINQDDEIDEIDDTKYFEQIDTI